MPGVEYLAAFSMRFTSACAMSDSSARTNAVRGRLDRDNARPRVRAPCARARPPAGRRTETGRSAGAMTPDSMRLRSRMSLITRLRRSACESIVSRKAAMSSSDQSTLVSRRLETAVLMPASGVLRSCEIDVISAVFISSACLSASACSASCASSARCTPSAASLANAVSRLSGSSRKGVSPIGPSSRSTPSVLVADAQRDERGAGDEFAEALGAGRGDDADAAALAEAGVAHTRDRRHRRGALGHEALLRVGGAAASR